MKYIILSVKLLPVWSASICRSHDKPFASQSKRFNNSIRTRINHGNLSNSLLNVWWCWGCYKVLMDIRCTYLNVQCLYDFRNLMLSKWRKLQPNWMKWWNKTQPTCWCRRTNVMKPWKKLVTYFTSRASSVMMRYVVMIIAIAIIPNRFWAFFHNHYEFHECRMSLYWEATVGKVLVHACQMSGGNIFLIALILVLLFDIISDPYSSCKTKFDPFILRWWWYMF